MTALARRARRDTAWPELVAHEPRLGDLLAAIRAQPTADPHFCGVRAWFGGRDSNGGYKARMVALVGHQAERDDPALRSQEAYRAAYRVLYDALPPCRGCPCGAVARVLYGVAAGAD